MDAIDRQKIELGRKGEEIALKYLTDKGYELIARNYRFKRFGELDLIMKDGKYLVFVASEYIHEQSRISERTL